MSDNLAKQTIDYAKWPKDHKEKEPQDMTMEELVEQRVKVDAMTKMLKLGLDMYNAEIAVRLATEKVNGTRVGKYSVSKGKRVTFETTLEQARELGAVKEAINADVLRALQAKGATIPGVKVSEYVMVREIKEGE